MTMSSMRIWSSQGKCRLRKHVPIGGLTFDVDYHVGLMQLTHLSQHVLRVYLSSLSSGLHLVQKTLNSLQPLSLLNQITINTLDHTASGTESLPSARKSPTPLLINSITYFPGNTYKLQCWWAARTSNNFKAKSSNSDAWLRSYVQ